MGNNNNKASSLRKSQSVPADTQKLAGDAPVFDKQKSVSHMRLNNAHDKPAKHGKAGKKSKPQEEEIPQLNRAEATFLPEFPLRGDLEELEYDVLDVIARGAFGNVIKVQVDDQKRFYAVKVLDKAQIIEEGAIRQCKDEATIQSMAGQHPFVVQAYEYWQSRRSLYIVLDYVPHGDMFTLWTFHGAFPESLVQLYIAEMAMVMDFLHNASVIYRDIKMENILFNAKGHIQLTDFGLAKWLQGGDQTRTVCGTLQYMAPEVLSVYPYSHSADWWSLGILMYAMLAGRYPVDGADTHTRMAQRVFECDFLLPSHISDSAQDVINRVLTKSPHKRLCDVNSLQDLDFFQGIFFSDLIEQKLSPLDVVPEDFFPMTGNSWAPQDLTNEEQGHFDQFDDINNTTLIDDPGYPHYHSNPALSHHHPEPVPRLQPAHLYNQEPLQENKNQYSSDSEPEVSAEQPHKDIRQYSFNSELRQQPPQEDSRQHSSHIAPQPHHSLLTKQLSHGKSLPDFQRLSFSHDTDLAVGIASNPFVREDRNLEGPVSGYDNRQAGSSESRRNSMQQHGNDRGNVIQSNNGFLCSVVPQIGYDGRNSVVSPVDSRNSVVVTSGYDGRSSVLPQSGYDGRSNAVLPNDGKSNVVPQSGYDGKSNIVPQSGYDGKSNIVPHSRYDGRSSVVAPDDGRHSVELQSGYDVRSNVVPQSAYGDRSNIVPHSGYDVRSTVVPQSGYDGRSSVVPQSGYDGRSSVVLQSGYDGRSNVVPQSGYDGRNNVVPQSGYDGRNSVVPQSGYDGKSNVVPPNDDESDSAQYGNRNSVVLRSGYGGRGNIVPTPDGRSSIVPPDDGRISVVPQSGYDGRSSVVPPADGRSSILPPSGYDGRNSVVPQSGYDGRNSVVPQSGYDGRNSVVPQSTYDGRNSIVPQSAYDGRSNVLPQNNNNFETHNKDKSDTRSGEDIQRVSTNQDRGSFNNRASLSNATRTNDDSGLSSILPAQSFNGPAGNTHRLSTGPEYKLVESAPTITLKAPLNSSQARFNQTAPVYSLQTSMNNPTSSGYSQQNNAIIKPATTTPVQDPTNYKTQVLPNSKINHQTSGFPANKQLNHGYKTLEAPPTVSVSSAQARLSLNPVFLPNRDLQRPPHTATSNNSTNAPFSNSVYHRLKQAVTMTDTTAAQITAAPPPSHVSALPKPVPPQKPPVRPKPAVPLKPTPAPRQSLRTDYGSNVHFNPEPRPSLTHSPGFPNFAHQRAYPSAGTQNQQVNPGPLKISTGSSGDYQDWASQVLPAAELSRVRSSSMSNMLSSDSDRLNSDSDRLHSGSDRLHSDSDRLNSDSDRLNSDSDRPNSLTRSPSIDDENFQWRLPLGTTPSFV